MPSEQRHLRSFWLTLIAVTFLFDVAAIRGTLLRANELGMDLFRSAWGGVLLLYLIVLLFCAWAFFQLVRDGRAFAGFLSRLDALASDSVIWRAAGFVFFGAVLVFIPWMKFSLQIGQTVENPALDPHLLSSFYYWMCWPAVLLAMLTWKTAFRTSWPVALISALVTLGVSYETWIRLGAVTDYPLSMGWSEGSRYYYASLYFSRSIYGEPVPLSTLHPTRYFLQSIPYLIPSLGLAAHRFWQFLLWIGLTSWASISIANRVVSPQEKTARWLIAGGLFIFLMRMGVYYHLEPMVILPMAFVSTKYPARSLLAVIVASLWAGVSRVNWFPMPAMIATAIYLLETPFQADESIPLSKRLMSYLSLPVLWMAVGLVSALIAQAAYIPLSGNGANADAFGSSFTSDLLWYRLLPNDNHFLGILPATLLFSFPLLITLFIASRQTSLHWVRWFGLWAMLTILFAGSLVVSAKIGGGGDLHNMDTFAVMLGVVAAYFIGGQVAAESRGGFAPVRPWPLLTLFVVVPLVFMIFALRPRPVYNEEKNENAYRTLKQVIHEAGEQGPVLLINERQLAAFENLNTPLIADYEAVTLMEMAMADNKPYLERFRNDLRTHRFSAIITNPQNTVIKTSGPLKEENNVWNARVAPYILCYYMPTRRIDTDWNRIEIYVPNPEAQNCP